MYQQNQVVNKPTAAYWLSMIGGILGLIAAVIVTITLGLLGFLTFSDVEYGFESFYALGLLWVVFGVWMFITSILVIVFARKLNANPLQHTKYGILIIIFSIIGVGGLLGLIGGILALFYKPQFAGAAPHYTQQYSPPPPSYAPPQQQYQQQVAHNCPQCGTMVQPGVRFCPNCGRQQY
jgi:ABC-type transport system involved in multi-copper enzyme maturation permease subunit